MGSAVKFQITKFIELDLEGNEKEVSYGYRIFDAYGKYCDDTLSLDEVKEMTPEKVLHIIEDDYDELYEAILDKGFYFHNTWVAVDETGTIVKE